MSSERPLIIGLGGASRPGSSTELVLSKAMEIAEAQGARTLTFGGAFLAELPIYRPEVLERTASQKLLIEAVSRADGVLIASPSYHAGPSALVKNALDLLEDLRTAPRSYLDGLNVGCIVTAGGWQGGYAALQALRATVHALRGWPTPLGVVLNTSDPIFANGELEARAYSQISEMVRQVRSGADQRFEVPVPIEPVRKTGLMKLF